MTQRELDKSHIRKIIWFTDNLSADNYIGHFRYGKLYRGNAKYGTKQDVMVKIYDISEKYNWKCHQPKMMREMIACRHEVLLRHPGMVKIIEYIIEEDLVAVIYEFKPFDTVYNLIPKDSFTWLQRIKTALGLASVLEFLHTPPNKFFNPFVVHNLDAANIVLDEEYTPKLCDVGLLTGGILPEGSPNPVHKVRRWDTGDVFAFGVILFSLLTKKVLTDENWDDFVRNFESTVDRTKSEISLAHESLESNAAFLMVDGEKITRLALLCVNENDERRPTMSDAFWYLKQLEAVNMNKEFFASILSGPDCWNI